LHFCSPLRCPASDQLLPRTVVARGATLRFPARARSMAGALEPGYGTNAPSRHARVLPARLASSGNLAGGPVGRPSRIGSSDERNASVDSFDYPKRQTPPRRRSTGAASRVNLPMVKKEGGEQHELSLFPRTLFLIWPSVRPKLCAFYGCQYWLVPSSSAPSSQPPAPMERRSPFDWLIRVRNKHR
jgi:hypothetical protein